MKQPSGQPPDDPGTYGGLCGLLGRGHRALAAHSTAMENGVQFPIGHSPIAAGTHLCHFGNRKTRLETAAHSIAVGIRAREVCLLICDDSLAKTIFIRVGVIGIDVHENVRKGSLIHLHGEEMERNCSAALSRISKNAAPQALE